MGNFLYGEWLALLVTSSNFFLLPITTALALSGLSFSQLELIPQWRCHFSACLLGAWEEEQRETGTRVEGRRLDVQAWSSQVLFSSVSPASSLIDTFFILLCVRYNYYGVNPKSEWHLPEISVLLSIGFGCNNFESFRKSLTNWDLETWRYSTLLFPFSVAKYVFTHHLLCARYNAAWWEI